MRALIALFALSLPILAHAQQAPPADQAAKPPTPCDVTIKGPVYKLLEQWKASCGHPLCGQIHIAEASRLKPIHASCEAKGWLAMKDDVRDTVVTGGVVMYGELHDNPLHHELRSRLGLSNYSSSVFEQIAADRSPALEEFLKQHGKNFTDASLAKFKDAVQWETSGWQQYKYDELLLSALRGQRPIYAGDASRDTIKTIAKDGLGSIAADEQKRLGLDVALGEKQDAAVLDELEASHCKAIPREALTNMALAQRFRDATLADSALNAVAKNGSTVLFAGNEHVRKDRGAPWYVRQRAPDKKSLSILLVEVEDGKTDAEGYVPRDPEGKPAADYVIFTPRAEHKDHCAEMKAKAPG